MKKRVPSEKEIAQKHSVSVEYVIRQAEIGSTVEREHVTTHEEAYGIALQHIAEFPDYYKHLLSMEKQLKKKWKEKNPLKEHCGCKEEKCNMSKEGMECPKHGKKECPKIKEEVSPTIDPQKHKKAQKAQKIVNMIQSPNPNEAKIAKKKSGPTLPFEEKSLVDKILSEIKSSDKVTIEDANGNPYVEFIDLIKASPLKESIDESVRLKSQSGNIIEIILMWRGKSYGIKSFFPQTRIPTRKEINDEIQKIYPGSRLLQFRISDLIPGEPFIQMNKSKNYVKPMGEEIEIEEAKKSEMPCNKPKAESHGSGETGKSHVVKACENGKEKLIRFGQKGVKGSPKKEGESEAYRERRERFKARHEKNIKKGKMSAAYWANKVKW